MERHAPSMMTRSVIILCALAVVFLLYIPVPIISEIAVQYDISFSSAAGTVSAFGFAYATGFLIFGPLSDRLGRRNVLIYGLFSLIIATWGLYFAHSLQGLLAGRALQGFCASAFTPTAIAYLSERGTERQKQWSIAWLSTAFLSAGLLGQLYGRAVAALWGMDTATFPLTLIYLLTILCLVRTPAEPGTSANRDLFSVYSPVKTILASADIRRVYVPAFFLLMIFVSFYIMPVFTQSREINVTLLKGVALPGFFATFASVRLIRQYGARNVITTGLIITASGILLSYWSVDSHYYVLLLSSLMFVSGISLTVPALIARIAELSHVSVRGVAIAIYTFLLFSGASLGPWLTRIAEFSGPKSGMLLFSIITLACACYSAVSGKSD